MKEILIPVVLVTAVGLLAGVLLTFLSKVFAVTENETAKLIRDALPGANCGACGYAGCDDYAAALAVKDDIATNLCVPGGDEAAKKIAQIKGVGFEATAKQVACVRCSGSNEKTRVVMDYEGIKTCAANKLIYNGRWACDSGCLAYGDCAEACPQNAITIQDGVAIVDRNLCNGCGICAKTCPQKLIEIRPVTARVVVGCVSPTPENATEERCDIGCIGCGKCEEACKFGAISVSDNHAHIDYNKCKNCTLCAKVCPRGVIKVYPKA